MNGKVVLWLRLSYWAGAILDVIAGLIMLFPPLYALNNQLDGFSATADFRYAMGMGAPLMLAWTVLLLWADRKPLERKGVLPVTILVILGEVINEVLAARSGYLPLPALMPTWTIQTVLTGLMAFSYWNAQKRQTA